MDEANSETTRAQNHHRLRRNLPEELDLPTKGTFNKVVYLPNNAKMKTSRQTKLPFKTFTNAAREADVLPGLK
jgi:hypothetical protein